MGRQIRARFHYWASSGPVGSALADYLVTLPGVEVHAFKRWRSDTRPIAHLLGRITVHEGDIEDPYSVARAVERAAPQRVVPSGSAELSQRVVGCAGRHHAHQCGGNDQSAGGGAPLCATRAGAYRRNQRRVWLGTSRRDADPRDAPHPSPQSLWREQGRGRIERFAVRCQLRFARCRHPFIQSRWSAPGRPVRHSDILPSDGADRA
jgi:hypothetical protein